MGRWLMCRHVIAVWSLRRVNMRHQIEHTVSFNNASTHVDRDIVSGFNRLGGVYLNVCINDDQIAHLACAQIVHAQYASMESGGWVRLDDKPTSARLGVQAKGAAAAE